MSVEEFLSNIKLSKEKQIALFILGSILILVAQSKALLEILHLEEFISSFLPYISIITILSFSLLIATPIKDFFTISYNKYRSKRSLNYFLKQLTNDEKELLQSYITDNVRVKYFEISDGIANGLSSKNILYRSSSVGCYMTSFSYNIQDISFNILKDNPKYLEIIS